jgi:DNA-binding transcriptional ArsR family regulator
MAANRSARADRGGELFKAIADPSRRRMLMLLAEHELPLKGIQERFQLSRPAVIKHLRILKSCRLVRTRRSGRMTMHRINPGPLRVVRDWVSKFDALWEDRLKRLKEQVEAEA